MPKSKRKYTMSDAARAQRRTAAVKTGESSQRAAVQAGVPPCCESTCPIGEEFPCQARHEAAQAGRHWSICVPALFSNENVADSYLAALKGRPEGLMELSAAGMAAQFELFRSGVAAMEAGVVADVVLEDGRTVQRLHPAAEFTHRVGVTLGFRASDHLLTPRAQGADTLGRNLVDALDIAMANRRRLEAGSEVPA